MQSSPGHLSNGGRKRTANSASTRKFRHWWLLQVMARFPVLLSISAIALSTMLFTAEVSAQEMTPRAYWPAPVGTTVGTLGYSHVTDRKSVV